MEFRTLSIGFILLTLILLPATITGCGTDEGDANTRLGKLTIGPGNCTEFPASGVCSLR